MAKEKYEDYQVDSDVDTLIKANELLNDDMKLPKIKKRFADRQEALSDTAKQLALESKVKKNLKKIFGKNTHAEKENKKTG